MTHTIMNKHTIQSNLGKCPACSLNQWKIVVSAHAGTYQRCRNCRHYIQTAEQKSDQHERFEAEQKKFFGSDSLWVSPIFAFLEKQRLNRRLDLLDKYVSSGRLIEVGPGRGGMLAKTLKRGYSVDAVEHSPVLAKEIEAEHGVKVLVGEFEKLEFEAEAYDSYMSFHVIEHVADVEAHLRKASSIVKRGGYAFIATPNADSFEHLSPFGLSPNYSSGHLQLFSRKSMRTYLEGTGWEVVQITTPAFVEYWIRAATSTIRLLKSKLFGKTIERGKFVDTNQAPNSKQYKLFRLFELLTKPIRIVQEKAQRGGELLIVARRV